jgi:hypothetical protein
MIFGMVFPMMEACGFYSLRLLGHIFDRGFSLNSYTTKKTSI